jgi:hypothetical protein
MHKFLLLFLPLVVLGQSSSKSVEKPPPPRKAAGLTVPPEAVNIGPGAWRYIDKEGKAWIYRATPITTVRMPEADFDAMYPGVKVTERGDTVRFERPTPMGPVTWERKRSELREEEKALLEHARSKAEEARVAEKAPEKK